MSFLWAIAAMLFGAGIALRRRPRWAIGLVSFAVLLILPFAAGPLFKNASVTNLVMVFLATPFVLSVAFLQVPLARRWLINRRQAGTVLYRAPMMKILVLSTVMWSICLITSVMNMLLTSGSPSTTNQLFLGLGVLLLLNNGWTILSRPAITDRGILTPFHFVFWHQIENWSWDNVVEGPIVRLSFQPLPRQSWLDSIFPPIASAQIPLQRMDEIEAILQARITLPAWDPRGDPLGGWPASLRLPDDPA